MAVQGNQSIVDVARRAGVSIATASRVLNASSHPVSAKTRERVLAAAQELGYAPSALARALVTKRSRILGVIVNDVVDPYFAEIARGVEDVAGRAGYLTMLCNADRHTAVEREYLNVLRDYNAEGVIFAGSGSSDDPENAALREAVEQARERSINVIALAPRDFPGGSITVDNRAAGYDAVDYLLSLGHRRIALVTGPELLITASERMAGCLAALTDHGLEPAAVYEGDFSFDSGQTVALRVLAALELPDAIVGANDETAIGVLTALRTGGLDVPGAISVMGIGDTRIARFLELSTVSVPTYELGAMAARRVLAADPAQRDARTVLPHRLVPRLTTTRRSRS
jgi:LacI family transcriptional regulator